ncbi:MAG: methyltransferase domain-containing protein [Actinomycetota bacterium]
MSADSYLLGGQPSELERLQLQSKVWEPSGRRLLGEIGDGRDLRVLDIGCGALGWLRLLSEWVGPQGQVVGTDIDEKLLGAALKSLQAEGMSNVELVVDDVFNSQLEPQSFDLVHARFIIAPLGRGSELVTIFRSLVKPRGWLVLEEWEFGPWHFNPPAPAAERLIRLIDEIFSHLGGEAGRELPALLREAGIGDPQIDAHVVALAPGNPYLRLPLQFSVSLEPRLLKLVTGEELEALRRDAEAELAEPHRWGTTPMVIQSWGQCRYL